MKHIGQDINLINAVVKDVQRGSNMTGIICVNKSQFVLVIFEPPYIYNCMTID
jgi:hypothetical protein